MSEMLDATIAATPHFHPGARLRAERINLQIINHLAARRVRAGVRMGERATPGAARRAMDLTEIKEIRAPLTADGEPEVVDVTRPGFHTAKIRLPAVLSRLTEADPRRRAAEAYAIAAEKIGAVAGASAEGAKMDGGQATNDGGVTTRLHHAETLRIVAAVVGAHGLALEVRRAAAHAPRDSISARALLRAVCIDGRDLAGVLADAGWSGHHRDVARLSDVVLICLEDLARALGLISPDARRGD